MEAVKNAGWTYVPELPTLWPGMLASNANTTTRHWPFAAPDVRYFYFARNALWLTSRVLGLEKGEVLVPSYHHGVEIEALIDAGARVRFYRVGPKWDVDLEDVERKIGPETKALYLTHYAGFPGPVAEMRKIADRHGLPLIEDCALSLLSADGETPLGVTGDFSVFCLYKTLPVPNGGALVVNGARRYSIPEPPAPPVTSTLSHLASSLLQNVELRGGSVGRVLRGSVRMLGKGTVKAGKVERVSTGTRHFNRRHVDLGMSPITKRLALAQDMERVVEIRRRNYFFLLGRLRDVSPPLFHELPAGVCPLFYPLMVEDKTPIMAKLRARGIMTVDFWRYFHPACDPREFPEVADLRRQVLEIPCHQDLSPEVMAKIADAIREALPRRQPKRAIV